MEQKLSSLTGLTIIESKFLPEGVSYIIGESVIVHPGLLQSVQLGDITYQKNFKARLKRFWHYIKLAFKQLGN